MSEARTDPQPQETVEDVLEQNIVVLNSLHTTGSIDDALFCKGILCVASEYAARDQYEIAVNLIAQIPVEYFEKHLEGQLKEDEPFYAVASQMAGILVRTGYSGLDSDDVRPTQPPALA